MIAGNVGKCCAGICRNRWKVERLGKRYCHLHDPVKKAERLQKKDRIAAAHQAMQRSRDNRNAVRIMTWPTMLDLLERAPSFGGDMPGPSRRTPTTTFSQAYRAWQAERNRMLEEVKGGRE